MYWIFNFGYFLIFKVTININFTLSPKCPLMNKPRSFNRLHYTYCKQKMKDIIEAIYVDMWYIVKSSYEPHIILVNGVSQAKIKSWIDEEKKKHLLSSKFKWIISNLLSPNVYERISNCVITE